MLLSRLIVVMSSNAYLWNFASEVKPDVGKFTARASEFGAIGAPVFRNPPKPKTQALQFKRKVSPSLTLNTANKSLRNWENPGRKMSNISHGAVEKRKDKVASGYSNELRVFQKKTHKRKRYVHESTEESLFSFLSHSSSQPTPDPNDLYLDAQAVEDLVVMQHAEILDLVEKRKIFDVHDHVSPRLYSAKFQDKVAEYLIDGGSLTTVAKKLNLEVEALKTWKRKLQEAMMSKKMKKKACQSVRPNSKLIRRQSGFNVTSEKKIKMHPCPMKPQTNFAPPPGLKCSTKSKNVRATPRATTVKSRYQVNELEKVKLVGHDLMEATERPRLNQPAVVANEQPILESFEDNYFLILDKGASDVSSHDGGLPENIDEVIATRLRLREQEAPKRLVSLFVCNKCRVIFRCSSALSAHEKTCSFFRPAAFAKE